MVASASFHTMGLDELSAFFDGLSVPTDKPGFYDHPKLKALEKTGVDVLEGYARFVSLRDYSKDYLDSMRPQITAGAKRLNQLLLDDGRPGACIDCSMSLSRMFDEMGIWNYTVKGALTLRFPKKNAQEPFHFWPIDEDVGSGREFGHKWVVAPPFQIIDLTLKLQEYPRPIADLLPNYVMTENATCAEAHVTDILSPHACAYATDQGAAYNEAYLLFNPNLEHTLKSFPAYSMTFNGVNMKYVPCAIFASIEPLGDIRSLTLRGRTAPVLFEQEIRPAMESATDRGS
jgi:hypothetical protein